MPVPLLSVLIVSYNCAPLTLAAARSVLREMPEAQVVVVDNGSSDAQKLQSSSLPLQLILNPENLGLSAAVQQAYQEASGEHILMLNPDTQVLPGSLQLMIQALKDPDVGGIGPRFWWDEERTMLLPPIPLPTVWDRCIDLLLQGRGPFSRWMVKKDLRTVMDFWSADAPVEAKMLSGAAIMTRREVTERVGVFDSSFFLYYEDSDWCQRVRRAGFKLLYHPHAEMVHLFNQSGKQNPEVAEHMAGSREIYLGRHFGRWKRLIAARVEAWLEQRATPPVFHDLGSLNEPPDLTWEGDGEYLVQVGLGPSFHPGAGGFAEGESFRFPVSVWRLLAPGQYWSRVVRLKGLEVVRVYRWEKVNP